MAIEAPLGVALTQLFINSSRLSRRRTAHLANGQDRQTTPLPPHLYLLTLFYTNLLLSLKHRAVYL